MLTFWHFIYIILLNLGFFETRDWDDLWAGSLFAKWTQEAEVWELGKEETPIKCLLESGFLLWATVAPCAGVLGWSRCRILGHRRLETVINFQLYDWRFPSYSLSLATLGSRITTQQPLSGCGKSPRLKTDPARFVYSRQRTGKYVHGTSKPNAVSLKSSGLIACGLENTSVYTY